MSRIALLSSFLAFGPLAFGPLAFGPLAFGQPAFGQPAEAQSPDRISGPFTHQNLTVFLIHGPEQLPNQKLLTLAEAMAAKKVIVHETGEVGELMIENVSNDEVFLHAGDIVKGGQQDRTLSADAILPRKSGKIPVESFCVESGRWAARQGEAVRQFGSSTKALSSKKLKVAARKAKDQGEVWREVEAAQTKLTTNVGRDVKSERSATSLQLTLENGAVTRKAADYVRALGALPTGKADVIGFAFAIGGRMNSAEVYGNAALFTKLWPKLLEASAIEAIAELDRGASGPVSADDVRKLMAASAKGKTQQTSITRRTKVVMQDAGDNVSFETRDGANADKWVHRSYY